MFGSMLEEIELVNGRKRGCLGQELLTVARTFDRASPPDAALPHDVGEQQYRLAEISPRVTLIQVAPMVRLK